MPNITDHSDLQQATLQSFVENVEPQRTRRLESVFPTEQTFDINVVYDIIEKTGIKAASIIGFDSGTPLRDKGSIKQAMAKLTKIAHAYNYTEEEMYKYLNPRSTSEVDALIRDVLISVGDLKEGVEETKELIRAGMVYRGEFDYEDPKTNVRIKFDLDLDDNNKISAGDFSREDVNPLEVLQEQVETYKDNNRQKAPAYMVMTSKTLSKIKRNPNVVFEIYGKDTGRRLVKDSDLLEMFSELKLPTLDIEDGQVTIDGIEGDITKQLLEDDKVVMHADKLGKTLVGPAADNNFAIGLYVVSVVSQDPVGEKTIVGEVAMPVLQNLKGISILTANEEADETP
ncbi:major capsid protein [Mammaliicoccus lentus]|uniref:major capsid protein n=1 Tax=Mammaliicoccus lentus TaxID=42858 RepID=UPI002DB9DFF9|nr:major capsid protein [Mammaliicoccus lentus]MEB8091846.1 major capsid protein [Mammaliicoccus lentus]